MNDEFSEQNFVARTRAHQRFSFFTLEIKTMAATLNKAIFQKSLIRQKTMPAKIRYPSYLVLRIPTKWLMLEKIDLTNSISLWPSKTRRIAGMWP